jgi:hypothetical protein
VTTPPAPQQQAPPQGDLDEPALALAIAALLATAISAAAVMAALKLRFALTADAAAALGAVLGDVMNHPPPLTGVIGAASAQTSRMNMARRAQYVLAASKRVVGAARDARSKGQPAAGAILDQLARERRYYAQHQAAMWNRARAAGATDMAAAEHGNLLGWYSVRDTKTSAECKAADGWNYYATAMPVIGFPGAVHEHCRCLPGAAHPGGKLLPAHLVRYARAA